MKGVICIDKLGFSLLVVLLSLELFSFDWIIELSDFIDLVSILILLTSWFNESVMIVSSLFSADITDIEHNSKKQRRIKNK